MARLRKSSLLVCLALLCHTAIGSKSNSDTSTSSDEALQSDEDSLPSSAIHGNGRGRSDIFFGDRSAQREMSRKFAPVITNPIRSDGTFGPRTLMAMQRGGSSFLPRPEEPSFLSDYSPVATSVVNAVRNVAAVIHGIPDAVGAFGSSRSAVISETVQRVLNSPAMVFSGQTSEISSSRVVYPSQIQSSIPPYRRTQNQASNNNPIRPSSSAQNSFPIGVVRPNQSDGNSHPVQFFSQSNDQGGLDIPVASGGVEPPVDYVPQGELFVFENFAGLDQINQGSFNGGGTPNLFPSQNTNTYFGSSTGSFNGAGSPNPFPSQNTHTNFGTTGSAIDGGSPNAFPSPNINTIFGLKGPTTSGGSPNVFPSRNTNTNFGSTGSSNGVGSPSAFPSQNTVNNFGSSTGSSNGESFQQPSTGGLGSPANGFPTNNNFFQSSFSTNRFPSQNTDQLGGGQSYPEISTVANGIQVFTLDLLDTFRTASQANVVYSPVSISSLLSLLTLATNGNSKHEIEVALFPLTSSSTNDQHSQYEKILERLNRLSPGITISTSSKLFLEEKVNIYGSFSDGAKKHYNCNVSLENFSRKPEQTMQRVNSWVEKETRGKITKFISQPFSTNTKFVAANTIYFDGEWATPFPEYFTAEREFDTGTEIIQIPMMTNVLETPHYYSKEFNVDVTSLPYRGGEFAMIIILPRESAREKLITDLERQLNTTTIESFVNNLASKSVSISLPKMKLAMKTSLIENLSDLRIQSIFSPSTADFSNLSDTKPLWVGQFLHEAVMEVTEIGTVAAGVSATSLDRIGGYQRINVNKPAIIFIRDMVTRVPLFWTRLVKPERIPESGQKSTKKF